MGKNHGKPFDYSNEEDIKELKNIMGAYEKNTDCEITIEVREDSYVDKPYNLIRTKKSLENLGYKLICN